MRYTFTSILILYALIIFAQNPNPTILWEKYLPFQKNNIAKSCVETLDGKIAIAGEIIHNSKEKDVYVTILNQNGSIINKEIFSGTGIDEVNKIISTFDGGLLIAGNTINGIIRKTVADSDEKKAWLVKLDQNGNFLWEMPLMSFSESKFNDLLQLSDGNIIAIGEKKNKAFAAKINQKGQLIKEIFFDMDEAIANAITSDGKGNIGITGQKTDKNKIKPFFLIINEKLESKGRIKSFPFNADDEIGKGIIFDFQKSKFLIATSANNSSHGNTRVYSVSNKYSANVSRFDKMPDRDFENQSTSIALLPYNKYLVTGYSNDSDIGLTRYNPLSNILNSQGKILAEYNYSMKNDNKIFDSFLQNDGNILIVGDAIKNKQIKSRVIKQNYISLKNQSLDSISVSNIDFIDFMGNQNDTLNSYERAYIPFDLKNNDLESLWGLKASVETSGITSGLDFFPSVNLGNLPRGYSKTFSIPLFGEYGLSEGEKDFTIIIRNQNNKELTRFTKKIDTSKGPISELKILKGAFQLNEDSIAYREKIITLEVKVTNVGTKYAKNVRMDFNSPYLVNPIGGVETSIDTLWPNDTAWFSFRFKVSYLKETNSVKIKAKVYEENYFFSKDFASFILPLNNFYELKWPNGQTIIPKIIKEYQNNKGGNALDLVYQLKEKIKINWYFHQEPTLNKRILTRILEEDEFIHLNYITLKTKIESSLPLFISDIKLIHRWGDDNTENLINSTDTLNLESDGKGNYFYLKKVYLKRGQNSFRFEITKNKTKQKSKTIRFLYVPPNLHLFSLGIPSNGLEVAIKDAEAFNDGFKFQDKTDLYEEVSKILVAKKGFTKGDLADLIGENMKKGVKKVKDGQIIHPQDIVVVYISSHGKIIDEEFQLILPTSDGKATRAFPLKKGLIDELSFSAAGKTLLFLDACYSGHIIKKTANLNPIIDSLSLIEILKASKEDLYIMASSSPSEESWCFDGDSLSVFTWALLQVLGKSQMKVKNTSTQEAVALSINACFLQIEDLMKKYALSKDKKYQNPMLNTSDEFLFFTKKN